VGSYCFHFEIRVPECVWLDEQGAILRLRRRKPRLNNQESVCDGDGATWSLLPGQQAGEIRCEAFGRKKLLEFSVRFPGTREIAIEYCTNGEWMRISFSFFTIVLLQGMVLGAASQARSQTPDSGTAMMAAVSLPEAPGPQPDAAIAAIPDAPTPQADAAPAQTVQVADAESAQDPAPGKTAAPAAGQSAGQGSSQTGSSSSQPGQSAATEQQPPAQQSQHQTAEEQLKQQKQQRILGIAPAFNTSYVSNAVSLTAGQKMGLAFRSSIDPFTFGAAFLVAGYHEALDQNTGFGWGPEGYFKRAGAAYLDSFNGNMIGNGILPSIFHQDPRYFRLGHGTFHHRMLYALATVVICKHDNTGRWEPNYSNVGGNIIAGGISNLYYPSQNSGWGQTITNGMIVTAEGGVGSIFQEFWPDLSRKFLHQDPTHGLDAQATERDKEQKQEEEQKQEQPAK
jgi:hypothetical protein